MSNQGRRRRCSHPFQVCSRGWPAFTFFVKVFLISEPEKGDPSRVMRAIKQGFSWRVLKSARKRRDAAQQELFAVGSEHVWQQRLYG
jgi:transcription initiation factor IIF auxiliary subunit